MLPAIVVLHSEVDLDERTPLRPLRFSDEVHVGFQWSPIRLFGITRNAGTDDVFPGSGSTPVAGDDVVEVQIFPFEDLPTVLAGVLVALENIVARKLDLLLGHSVEKHQNDYARNADAEGDGMDALRMGLCLGNIVPFLEIVGLKGAVFGVQDDLSMTFEEQSESPASGANIHRLPQPVQH